MASGDDLAETLSKWSLNQNLAEQRNSETGATSRTHVIQSQVQQEQLAYGVAKVADQLKAEGH